MSHIRQTFAKKLSKRFSQDQRDLALELALKFLLAVITDGVSKDELEDLQSILQRLHNSLKDPEPSKTAPKP